MSLENRSSRFPNRSHINRAVQNRDNFGFRKKSDCTICVAKTKALINCTITAQLIYTFNFAYSKSRFSHDAVHIFICSSKIYRNTIYHCKQKLFRNQVIDYFACFNIKHRRRVSLDMFNEELTKSLSNHKMPS